MGENLITNKKKDSLDSFKNIKTTRRREKKKRKKVGYSAAVVV